MAFLSAIYLAEVINLVNFASDTNGRLPYGASISHIVRF